MANSKLISASLLLLISLVLLSGVAMVSSDSPSGSFTFVVDGYTVKGDLTGGTVDHGGLVGLVMSIDQTISTSYGTVHIIGNGIWSGQTDFQNVNGVIEDVTGTAQACAVFVCQTTSFTGSGTWAGSMSWSSDVGSQGSGTFEGTLTFTGQRMNQTGPVPISGNWAAGFET
jgi:hypothetical protein